MLVRNFYLTVNFEMMKAFLSRKIKMVAVSSTETNENARKYNN